MLSSKPEQQQQDQTTTPGTTFPTLCKGCVGSLTSPATALYNHLTLKMPETGPMIFRPYPRRHTVHSEEFLCIFCFVSYKTPQNINILQLHT